MFRPPPTIVEIGTEEDIRQFEEVMRSKSSPSPIVKANPKPVFDSPDIPLSRNPRNIATPTGSLDSPL
jgi:hypothetical protein